MQTKKFHYAWFILLTCCAIQFVGVGLVWNTAGLFYTPLCDYFGFTRAQISLMSTIQAIANILAMSYCAKLFYTKDARLTLSVSFAVLCLTEISASFYTSLPMFYVMGAITGLCAPICISLSCSTLLNNWFEGNLGLVIGVSTATSGIGGMLFNPIVSRIITESGWQMAYRFIGIAGLVIILPFTLFVVRFHPANMGLTAFGAKEKTTTAGATPALTGLTLAEARKVPEYLLMVVTLCAVSMVAGVTSHIAAHVVNIGYSLVEAASVVSGLMLGAAVGKLVLGALLDKVNTVVAILIFAVFGVLGWGGLLLHPSQSILTASGFIVGLAQAILFVASPFLTKKIFGLKEFTGIYASMQIYSSAVLAVSTFITGLVFDKTQSYSIILTLNVILFVVAFVCVATALKLSAQRKAA